MNNSFLCDLHTHSNFSDGTFTPTEIVKEAKRLGLSAIALCDHNTIKGLDEFTKAGKENNIETINGIEISTDYGENTELHIVGLFIKEEYFDKVTEFLRELKINKEKSNCELIKRLCENGYDIDYDALKSKYKDIQINRAYIASALYEKGYANSVAEVFDTIFAKNGKFNVKTKRICVFEAIKFLKSIGAVSVLAHPFLDLNADELKKFLTQAKQFGLDAMETNYSTYDEKTTILANSIAEEFNILKSGGSDFHGYRKPDIFIGSGRGNLIVPTMYLEKLKERVING